MKKILSNVGQVLVETQTGDTHKEGTGQSTHSLDLSGLSTETKPLHSRCHYVVFHRSHSHFLTMSLCDILLSLATSLRGGMT